VPLTRYGLREWMLAAVIAAAIAVPAGLVGLWWLVGVAAVLFLAVAWFFRDPPFRRPADPDPRAMVSPADGKVTAVFVDPSHPGAEGGPALVIRIFLSVLDVHVNRAPAGCTVTALHHAPGKYLDARTEESARVNESNLVRLRLDDGLPIAVRQVSGAIARRIVCPLAVGDRLERGQRFGMIKFGSTTELIIGRPDDHEPAVREGDRVVGGVTILARPR